MSELHLPRYRIYYRSDALLIKKMQHVFVLSSWSSSPCLLWKELDHCRFRFVTSFVQIVFGSSLPVPRKRIVCIVLILSPCSLWKELIRIKENVLFALSWSCPPWNPARSERNLIIIDPDSCRWYSGLLFEKVQAIHLVQRKCIFLYCLDLSTLKSWVSLPERNLIIVVPDYSCCLLFEAIAVHKPSGLRFLRA